MINTSVSSFVLESGSQQQFNLSSIICEPTYMESNNLFRVVMKVQDSVSTEIVGRGSISVTSAEVDAETGSGTGETAPWFNALQKAVITKLSAYTGNASTTFTIV